MGLRSKLIVGGVAAGASLAYYIRRRHERTGMGYLDIIVQLPSEAQRWAGETRRAATRALEDGMAAARAREEEFTRQLEAAASPPDSAT